LMDQLAAIEIEREQARLTQSMRARVEGPQPVLVVDAERKDLVEVRLTPTPRLLEFRIGERHGLSMLPSLHKPFRSGDLKSRLITPPVIVEQSPVRSPAEKIAVDLVAAIAAGWLELWYQRMWDLHGLWLDPDGRVIRYKGGEVSLTIREFQLLQFLLDHPHRYFKVSQILGQAWGEPSLFPEEVRNYVRRVRKLLKKLDIPCDLVNRPGRGYSLVYRDE